MTIDKKEYDDICRSFMLASVPLVDTPADMAIGAVLLQAADVHKIKYVIDGHSFRTEGSAPIGMVYMDANIFKVFKTNLANTLKNLSFSVV